MLKYLIILTSSDTPSFCHYAADTTKVGTVIMPLDVLHKGIDFAMRNNWTIQIAWGREQLPQEYLDEIFRVEHANIVPVQLTSDADVLIIDADTVADDVPQNANVVFRTTLSQLSQSLDIVKAYLHKVNRLNITLADIQTYTDAEFDLYKSLLEKISEYIRDEYVSHHVVQCNILTDRLGLNAINSCGAGDTSLTLAPDGKFYICPGFYYSGFNNVGDVHLGVQIPNQQLYKLDYAPICRICDAYQCKRCIWLNKTITYEVNTPSHRQCVIGHCERNATAKLLLDLRKYGSFMPEMSIKDLDYNDPYELIIKKYERPKQKSNS